MHSLAAKHSARPADVEIIITDLTLTLGRQKPRGGYECRFSMPFCLAHTLVYRRLEPDGFIDERLQEPWIPELRSCTRHLPDSSLLTVVLNNGAQLTEAITTPGDLKGWGETVAKFKGSTGKLLSEDQQCTIIQSIQGIHDLSSIPSLTASLRLRAEYRNCD